MRRIALLAAGTLAVAACATAGPSMLPRVEPAAGRGEPAERAEPVPPERAPPEAPGGPARLEPAARPDPIDAGGPSELQARLAARARSFLGKRGPFRAAGQTFRGDCSGFVEAVYAAEGIDLRESMRRDAPRERGGARAAWLASRAAGGTFAADARAAPGDLLFWHDTYDRNRNRKADDPFTHVGIVEDVADGTVRFIHRGGKGVERGVMTLSRRHEASDPDGRELNSVLRSPRHPVRKGGLAGELFAGFGRIEGPLPGPPDRVARTPAPRARAGHDRRRQRPAPVP